MPEPWMSHRCDDRCVCRLHDEPKPLIYARGADQHCCQDVDCENGHGMWAEMPWGLVPV